MTARTMTELQAARLALTAFSARPGFVDALERFEAAVRANERSGTPPAAAQTEPVCICGHPVGQHFEDTCLRADCGCADCLEPEAAFQVLSLLRKPNAAPAAHQAERGDRYAEAIHDAMEPDLSLVDQEPEVQALFACAAEAAVAVADAEQAALRAAVLREASAVVRGMDTDPSTHAAATELSRMADEVAP